MVSLFFGERRGGKIGVWDWEEIRCAGEDGHTVRNSGRANILVCGIV